MHVNFMINNKLSRNQNQASADALGQTGSADQNRNGIGIAPSADAVASRAYRSYGNRVSLPDHIVEHWLEAESQLLAERALTR